MKQVQVACGTEPKILNYFVLTRTPDEWVIRDENGTLDRGPVALEQEAGKGAAATAFHLAGRSIRLQREVVIEGNLLEPTPQQHNENKLWEATRRSLIRATVRVDDQPDFPLEAEDPSD